MTKRAHSAVGLLSVLLVIGLALVLADLPGAGSGGLASASPKATSIPLDPLIGQIAMFGGNFAPRGWALCDGQLLPIDQNQALFSVLGTSFGGDGRTTFALPDLRGRMAMHAGTGPGLTPRRLGQSGGSESVTLTVNQMPRHSHALMASEEKGNSIEPIGNVLTLSEYQIYRPGSGKLGQMASSAVGSAGSDQAHDNMPPFATITYIIALQGVFPSRN